MKTSKIILLICIGLFIISCEKEQVNEEPEFFLHAVDVIDDMDYQIYSIVLKNSFNNNNKIIIKQNTSKSSFVQDIADLSKYLSRFITDIDSTIFPDYLINNESSYYLDNKFNQENKEFHLITNEELSYIFSEEEINEGWYNFHDKYPDSNGYIQLSRIGYNTDENQAIIEVSHYYASLGAEGSLIYLVKNANTWEIVITLPTWVS